MHARIEQPRRTAWAAISNDSMPMRSKGVPVHPHLCQPSRSVWRPGPHRRLRCRVAKSSRLELTPAQRDLSRMARRRFVQGQRRQRIQRPRRQVVRIEQVPVGGAATERIELRDFRRCLHDREALLRQSSEVLMDDPVEGLARICSFGQQLTLRRRVELRTRAHELEQTRQVTGIAELGGDVLHLLPDLLHLCLSQVRKISCGLRSVVECPDLGPVRTPRPPGPPARDRPGRFGRCSVVRNSERLPVGGNDLSREHLRCRLVGFGAHSAFGARPARITSGSRPGDGPR